MSAHPRNEEITLWVEGREVRVRPGSSVAAALLRAAVVCRISVAGEPRAPLCGMGICMECRATVDGVANARTCQIAARNGMKVVTG